MFNGLLISNYSNIFSNYDNFMYSLLQIDYGKSVDFDWSQS